MALATEGWASKTSSSMRTSVPSASDLRPTRPKGPEPTRLHRRNGTGAGKRRHEDGPEAPHPIQLPHIPVHDPAERHAVSRVKGQAGVGQGSCLAGEALPFLGPETPSTGPRRSEGLLRAFELAFQADDHHRGRSDKHPVSGLEAFRDPLG